MNTLKPQVRRQVTLIVLTAIAAGSLAMWMGTSQAQIPVDPLNQLKPFGRDRLAVCVGMADGVLDVGGAARSGVEQALSRLPRNAKWVRYGYHAAPPVVDLGCPSVPAGLVPAAAAGPPVPLSVAQATAFAGKPALPGISRRVQNPAQLSKYTLHVYVISNVDSAARFEGPTRLPRTAGLEVLCDESGCVTASNSVYVSVQELGNPEFIAGLFEEALGLRPEPTPLPAGMMPPLPPGVMPPPYTPVPIRTPGNPWSTPQVQPSPWQPRQGSPVPTQHVPLPPQAATPGAGTR